MEIEVAMKISLIFWTLLAHGEASDLNTTNSSHPWKRLSNLAANIKRLQTEYSELKNMVDSLERETTTLIKCDDLKRKIDAKNAKIAALEKNIALLEKTESGTETKNTDLQRNITEAKASHQQYLGIKLMVLYNAAVFSPILDRPEIQESGKYRRYGRDYVKCRIPGLSAGKVTSRTLRCVLQPLFKEKIRGIHQSGGKITNGTDVAWVTSKDTDTINVEWQFRKFSNENGGQWVTADLFYGGWYGYRIESSGKLLLCGGGRRTVFRIER